jgi:hypothetical protein
MRSKEGLIKLNAQLSKDREERGLCLAQENHETVPHCLIGELIECEYRMDLLVKISGQNYYKCSYIPTYRRKRSS